MFVHLSGRGSLNDQIYQTIRRAILTGHVPAAFRLPSTRALARELGVSRNTVLLAYDQLLAEGYAKGRQGSGTYVAATLPDTAVPVGSRRVPAHSLTLPRLRLSAYGRRLAGTPVLTLPSFSIKGRLPYDFGLHLLVWLRGISPNGVDRLVQRATDVGVGLYPIAPYYLRPPRRVGLLLGYAGLTEASIRTGIRRLADVL